MFNVSESIKYIGADDNSLDLFESQYEVPFGVSYNSYVCIDKKTAVFDTVDSRKTEEWLSNLEEALNGRKPDFLIISHVEPDHSAGIPAFLEKYPQTVIVGNERTFLLLDRFYGKIGVDRLVIKENEELDLGAHKLTFIFANMVHWPEVMMTYDRTDKVLFSADAFGKFGTLSHNQDWLDEARRYYINIVGKYGNPVQAVLKKISALEINTICPLHGNILKDNLGYYIDKYNVWSKYLPEEDGVFIAYASIYGNTANASRELCNELLKRGIKAETLDLTRCDLSYAVASAFKYSRLVIASVTYDGAVMPCAEAFINRLKAKNYCNRKVGFIQNGSWAPSSAKLMRTTFESFKNITLCDTDVTVNSVVGRETLSQIKKLADELI